MENMTNNAEEQQSFLGKTVHRRALLKAGWILPVIAVTPLINTASAMSSVDCDALLLQRDAAKRNKDRATYDAAQRKLDANGCPC